MIKYHLIIYIHIIIYVFLVGCKEIKRDSLSSHTKSLYSYVFVTKWGSKGNSDGEFGGAINITADLEGNIYVADIYNNRIQKFTSEGKFIIKWGAEGMENGKFKDLRCISVGDNGDIYTTEGSIINNNKRIQRFTSKGKFISAWTTMEIPYDFEIARNTIYIAYRSTIEKWTLLKKRWVVIPPTPVPELVTTKLPYAFILGIAIDSENNILALIKHVYLGYDKDWKWTEFSYNSISTYNYNGIFIKKWDIEYKFEKKNKNPVFSSIAVDSSDNILLGDISNNCIKKFDSSGKFITKFGNEDTGGGQFKMPGSITIDKDGNIYVADSKTCCIQKFKYMK